MHENIKLNSFIDHTLLKTNFLKDDLDKICQEALKFQFASVCVPPVSVSYVREKLKGSSVKTCTVIGFPNGYNSVETKLFEIKNAISNGAEEVDVVLNLLNVRNKDWNLVGKELTLLNESKESACLKVIIESGILTDEEIKKICEIANSYTINFLKTSTGFAKTGATENAVKIMRSALNPEIKIKASGGIRTTEDALKYINLGADRLGCSSSVEIIS